MYENLSVVLKIHMPIVSIGLGELSQNVLLLFSAGLSIKIYSYQMSKL